LPGSKVSEAQLRKTHKVFCDLGGSIRATSKVIGISRNAIRARLARAEEEFGLEWKEQFASGRVTAHKAVVRKLPAKNKVKRYIVTSAQNNTHAHYDFWNNLLAYAAYLDAEVMVSQYTYNKMSYGRGSVKPGREPTADDVADLWYDDCFDGYLTNDKIQLCPDLIFCAELNILPTAIRPLTGLETYAGQSSAIFPHAKIALTSVPALKCNGTKFNYTTGTVTTRNYISKKEGLRADFHHAYGALIVEVNNDGDWWVRQLNASTDGSFQDLDHFVADKTVSDGRTAMAINWGDVHVEVLDDSVRRLNWGAGGILDTLKPIYQFMHDTVDFRTRNHWDRKDPHINYEKFLEGRSNVKEEFDRVRVFLEIEAHREWCKTIVVDSNHDNATERWLREGDYKTDPENAVFFLEAQLLKYKSIRDRVADFHLVEALLRTMGLSEDIRFLREDESFVICDERGGGIECSIHGHLGPNGMKGSPIGLSRMGRKANTGHTHSTQIIDGMYVAGTCSRLKLHYNEGPSSWSHSHVVTYPNGKRAIITAWNGKWRA
jgi:hypothetical protein